MSIINTLETNIVTRLIGQIDALKPENGGTCKGVADVMTFMNISVLPTPSAIVVFDGEQAAENSALGTARQETQLYWSIFIVASSFSSAGEGRTSAYDLIDQVISALQGFVVNNSPISKLFLVSCNRYDLTSKTVTYQVRMRCNHTRNL